MAKLKPDISLPKLFLAWWNLKTKRVKSAVKDKGENLSVGEILRLLNELESSHEFKERVVVKQKVSKDGKQRQSRRSLPANFLKLIRAIADLVQATGQSHIFFEFLTRVHSSDSDDVLAVLLADKQIAGSVDRLALAAIDECSLWLQRGHVASAVALAKLVSDRYPDCEGRLRRVIQALSSDARAALPEAGKRFVESYDKPVVTKLQVQFLDSTQAGVNGQLALALIKSWESKEAGGNGAISAFETLREVLRANFSIDLFGTEGSTVVFNADSFFGPGITSGEMVTIQKPGVQVCREGRTRVLIPATVMSCKER